MTTQLSQPLLQPFTQSLTLEQVTRLAASGQASDVDYLMGCLDVEEFVACKLVDFGLSQVEARPGRLRIRHYLFNGTLIQRNYAALYFKRRGFTDTLDEAVALGCIDEIQAYAE